MYGNIVNLNRKEAINFLNLDEKYLIIILYLLINLNLQLEIKEKNIILIWETQLNKKTILNISIKDYYFLLFIFL